MAIEATFQCEDCSNRFNARWGGTILNVELRCEICDSTEMIPRAEWNSDRAPCGVLDLGKETQAKQEENPEEKLCSRCCGKMRDDLKPMCPVCKSRQCRKAKIVPTLSYRRGGDSSQKDRVSLKNEREQFRYNRSEPLELSFESSSFEFPSFSRVQFNMSGNLSRAARFVSVSMWVYWREMASDSWPMMSRAITSETPAFLSKDVAVCRSA